MEDNVFDDCFFDGQSSGLWKKFMLKFEAVDGNHFLNFYF